MLLLVFVSTAVLASVFLSLTVAFACSTSIPPRTMSFTLLAVGAEAPDCIVNFIASRPVSNAAVFRFSQRGFLYAVFRNASSAVEGDEESCGRQGMALNSCVGSQVCVQPLHSPGHADAGDAGAEPASGVGLPCFISALVSGQGGSVQVHCSCCSRVRSACPLTH